ncbi:MAG: ChaN family lipoprotein [Cyclobacteriaceae bacterium]|nr:ChaN family lipoprotein [Cyclobacteriaceae bacterium]
MPLAGIAGIEKPGGGENNALVLGAEMFEADSQLVLDEYLSGQIKEEHLLKEGKVWPNYKTDYAPLVNFARDNSMPFIATNIPRRYASIVARDGLAGLEKVDNKAKQFIAPLPVQVDFELPSYKEMAEMMGGQMPSAHGGQSMVEAQAIKDATMAYFISKSMVSGKVFYHINGSFHSKDNEGIIWYLKKSNPELRIRTIAVVEQDSLEEVEEDYKNQADFIIIVPSDMTKTY